MPRMYAVCSSSNSSGVTGGRIEQALDREPAHDRARAARDLARRQPVFDAVPLCETADQAADRVEEVLAYLDDGAAQWLAARCMRHELGDERCPARLAGDGLEQEVTRHGPGGI
jgi:hypothetical protein